MHAIKLQYRFKKIGINVTKHRTVSQNSNFNKKLSEILPNIDKVKQEMLIKSDVARSKFNEAFQWYERFTGISEVRLYQQKVLDAQDQFVEAQNKRREVHKQLSEVQMKQKDIHEKLQLTKPGEPKHLKLVMDNHEIIGQETKLNMAFNEVEKLERELFTSLTTAVRISQEQERLQADRTKYWSIIGSIIGTIIGLIGSSINNGYRMKEIKCILDDIAKLTRDSGTNSTSRLQSIEKLLKQYYEVSSNATMAVVNSVNDKVQKSLTQPTKKEAIAVITGEDFSYRSYFTTGIVVSILAILCCCR